MSSQISPGYLNLRLEERRDYFVGNTPIKNKLEKLDMHLKEFEVENLPWIDDFREWLLEAPNYSKQIELELSNKLSNEDNSAGRFNIWYDSDCNDGVLKKIFETLRKYSSVDEKLESFFRDEINKPGVKLFSGMDIREDSKECRIKLWLIYDQLPERLPEYLTWFGSNSLIDSFKTPEYFSVGYNFYEKKPPEKKLYFVHSEERRKVEQFLIESKKHLSGKTQALLNLSDEVYMSFDQNKELIMFFAPKLPYEFAHELKSENCFKMIKRYHQIGFKLGIVGLRERDITVENVENINTYYGF